VGDPQIADWTDPIPAYIAEITSGEPPSGGLGAAEIDVQGSVEPEDEVIDLLVTENECANGRDAEGRVRIVQETYSASRVEVLIGVERMGGDCPSNPPTPVTIRLIEPLGDRELSVISVSGETAGLPPTPSPSPSPTAPPAQVAAGPATVAQQMPLRTDPYVVASVVKHVQRGQIVYVLEGSVTVQERTWRLVQFSGDSDDGYGAGAWSGWVEEPELQRSVRPATPVCPEEPTLAELVALSHGARLWCYGDRPLTLTPMIAGHSRQGESSDLWLSGEAGIVQPIPYDSLPYHTPEGSDVKVRLDRWHAVTGHFDDPAAMGCVRAATEPDLAFLECRERFVVTSAIPADPPDSEAPGTWRRIADAPIPGRNRTAGVWTGSEMIVWGGGSRPDGLADGAAYDPQRDRWRVLAESPLRARVWHAFAWTGELLFIWGGEANSRDALADGALYDPRRDEWRSMAPAPIGGGRAKAVWTGELVVVVTHAGQAAMYDADTDRWERLPDLPSGPGGLQLIWTGARVMALDFGEWTGAVEISLLDPAAGAWEALGPTELNAGGSDEAIWTGNELIVLAGDDPIRTGPSGPGTLLTGRFDPTTGTWEEIPLTCDINTSGAVWTGRLVVTESGTFDPADGTCRMLPRAPVREASGGPHRESWTPVWTGTEMIFWSGYAYSAAEGARVPADGSAFRPEVP
ncbi:MAG: hypothetical protein H0V04_01160, partial [Chloroflexi bacterium]|nr:hypothetical protein [Chloroflexota bacterium]